MRALGLGLALFTLVAVACTGSEADPVVAASPPPAGSAPPPGAGDGGAPPPPPPAGAVCLAPLADCDDNAVCETRLDNDPKHCGYCGHDCGAGAACVSGACQAVTLKTGLDRPVAIAVNSGTLAVLTPAGVGVCPKDGCPSDQLRSLGGGAFEVPAQGNPHSLYLDEQNAYWIEKTSGSTSYSDVLVCDIAGCGLSPQPLLLGGASEARGAELVGEHDATNGSALLRYDSSADSFKVTVPLTGSREKTPLSMAFRELTRWYAVANGKMAFNSTDSPTSGSRGVWVGDFANAVPTRLMGEGNMVAFAGDAVFATLADAGGYEAIYRCPLTGCGLSGSKFGGTGADARTGVIADIKGDASGLYWVEAEGTVGRVMQCRLPDCPGGPKALAVAQKKPLALALDDRFVYWLSAGNQPDQGTIMRVAK